MTRIVIDAMGSDHYPQPEIDGAMMAAREYGVSIILVGDELLLKPALASAKASRSIIGSILPGPAMPFQLACSRPRMNSESFAPRALRQWSTTIVEAKLTANSTRARSWSPCRQSQRCTAPPNPGRGTS